MYKKHVCLVMAMLLAIGILFSACRNGATTPDTKEETTVDIMQKEDPGKDDTLNILMIGNSFCYYYVDELYGMLDAAGVKANVCNVYYSGCTLDSHWTWWKNNEAHYEYFETNADGRKRITQEASLEYCLSQRNWNVISLQESLSAMRNNGGTENHLNKSQIHRTDLWSYIKDQFPQSRHLWHQTWSYQIGYDRNGYKMQTLAQQETDMESMKAYSVTVCEELGLERVNTGEAWQIVRRGGYDNLCARLAVNAGEGDYYHDGDIGGGQYLNACVWFEVITGKSCIGNTYRPTVYELSEDLIQTLQQAAHQAVAALH